MERKITALIDGDWIMYAAGFAGQRTRCVYTDPALVDLDGAPMVFFGDTMTEIKKQLDEIELLDEYSSSHLYKREELDPETHFYHSAKMMIERNCEQIAEKFDGTVVPRVIIDGDGNFRSRLATIRPYKGTRNVHAKPMMYNKIRQYLLEVWGAEVVHDQESDDEMAIIQTEYNNDGRRCIIVGVDKDMLQVPGWHLNPNKGFKFIGPQEAEVRLYVQAAMGDSVDNIAGAYKVGPKAAKGAFSSKQSEEEKWEVLVSIYQNSIDKYGNGHYGDLSAEQAALENMRLVYLRRTEGELWLPPSAR